MRPNVPEIVRGLSATLAEGILPELTTPWAQAQVRYMLGLLDTVAAEWDGAADALVRENAALQKISALAAELADQAGQAADLDALAPGLDTAARLGPTSDLRLSTLCARNTLLWEAVIPLIELVVDAESRTWAGRLEAELRPLLRQYVSVRAYRPGGG